LSFPCKISEWDNADSFNTFITSPDFAAFVDKSKPFAAGPTKPQLYETNLGPAGCGAAPIAEIVQMKVGSGSQSAEKAWDNLVALIEQHVDAPMRAIRGRSLNLDEEVFLGVLGWDSVEVSNAYGIRSDG